VWKTKILKLSKFLLVFLVIFAWIFSGFSPIWHKPLARLNFFEILAGKIPPEIQEAQAL
jgi:hypothetical protein